MHTYAIICTEITGRQFDDVSCARMRCTKIAGLQYDDRPCTRARCTEILEAGLQYDG